VVPSLVTRHLTIVGHSIRRNLPFTMGRGKSKSFKPARKDKPRVSSKKSKKPNNTGIIRGRVESSKTEQKVRIIFVHGLTCRKSNASHMYRISVEYALIAAITNYRKQRC
jgi:hypothetical protein